MANKHRCEVPFPEMGEGLFIRFTVDDLARLEDELGSAFFDEIEKGCGQHSPKLILTCLKIGLKKKSSAGNDEYAFSDIDMNELQDGDFTIGEASKPILEALSQSWLGKTYDQLVEEAEKNRKAEEKRQVEAAKDAVKTAMEVAKDANLPFNPEASLQGLLSMLTGAELTPTQSGN